MQYISDYFEGKITTFYEQIPRPEAEAMRIWPKFALCVPYNGLYFSFLELKADELQNVSWN